MPINLAAHSGRSAAMMRTLNTHTRTHNLFLSYNSHQFRKPQNPQIAKMDRRLHTREGSNPRGIPEEEETQSRISKTHTQKTRAKA
jgi:hypothetical protein